MILLLLILFLIENSFGDIPADLLKSVELQHQKFSSKLVEYENEYNKTKNSIDEYREWYLKEILKEIFYVELNRMRIEYESHTKAQICVNNLNKDMKILIKTYDYKKCYPQTHYVNILRRFQKFRVTLDELEQTHSKCLKGGHENLEKCFGVETDRCLRTLNNLGFDIEDFLVGALHYSANCLWLKVSDVKNDVIEVSFKYFKCVYEQPDAKID